MKQQLAQGTAEVFGIEMAVNREYVFSGSSKAAVFSWYGCTLNSRGEAEGYVATDTPMVSYVNVHAMVEQRREQAASTGGAGPRVLVAGPVDAGKSSLARILLAYGVRMGRKPLYVDLDVGQGDISVPGTIGAAQLDTTCIDVEEGFSFSIPLVYWYGSASLAKNKALFKALVDKLAGSISQRFDNNPEGACASLPEHMPYA